jgi:hypothetical protein
LITVITFWKENKLWSSSLCSFLCLPITYFLSGPYTHQFPVLT